MAAGVTRARAAVAFDPMSQRPRVTVWVGDDGGAVTAAQQAFAASADPNRQPRVVLAQAVEMTLSLTIVVRLPARRADRPDRRRHRPGRSRRRPARRQRRRDRPGLLRQPGLRGLPGRPRGRGGPLPGFHGHARRFAPIYTRYRASELIRLTGSGAAAQPKAPIVSTAPATCCGERHDPGPDSYLFLPDGNLTIGLEAAP